MDTETQDKTAAPKSAATDPNASKTNAENPVETHEAQTALYGDDEAKSDTDKVETVTIDKDFVFVHNLDPARQIPGTNKYLDVEQRKAAEIDRAAVEGREPDFDNLPASQGTPYRSVEQLAAELPPSATVRSDVTLPVTVTKDDAERAQDAEDRAKEIHQHGVFNDPAKAQDRKAEGDVVKTEGADGAKKPQDNEGNKNSESGK